MRPLSGQRASALPEARAVLGEYYYRGFYDYERALEQLEIAHRQLPNNADILYMLGLTQRRLGLWDESVRSFEESTILDPENLRNYGELLDTLHDAMRWEEAIAAAERVRPRSPPGQSPWPARWADLPRATPRRRPGTSRAAPSSRSVSAPPRWPPSRPPDRCSAPARANGGGSRK